MKPDRFARVVEKVRWSDPDYPVITLRLLRAEHRAVVRLVKQHKFSKPNNAYEAAWNRPLNMILAALARRAK